MGEKFAVTFVTSALSTNAHDLVSLLSTASSRVRVRSVKLGPSSSDGAAFEALQVSLLRGSTVALAGAATTPVPIEGHAGAKQAVTGAALNSSTVLASSLREAVHVDAMDDSGFEYCPAHDLAPTLDVGQRFSVQVSAPSAAMTIAGTIVFEEIGLHSA